MAFNPAVTQRERLVVFLPGSNAIPDQYTEFVQAAADTGFHALGLRYPNSWSVNLDLCGLSSDPNCHERVRYEILEGIDTSDLPEVDVSPANCIRNRLVRLLQYLDATRPSEHWSQYLAGEQPRWERIAVAGHSQGGGHAAFIGRQYLVARVVMLAGGTDLFFGQPDPFAPWLDSHVTPSARYWGLVHEQDNPTAFLGAWEILGLGAFGTPCNVDDNVPPYRFSHQLLTAVTPPDPNATNAPHNTIVVDDYLTRDAAGIPLLLPAWRYLLTTPGPDEAFQLSPAGDSYIDPEILSAYAGATFQDQARNVWHATLDPLTGRFRSGDGRETLIDVNAAPTALTNNGPEFGLDAGGWAVFYSKNVAGTPQTWRAEVSAGIVTTQALTSGAPHISSLARTSAAAPTTGVLALRGTWSGGGTLLWFDEANPSLEHEIEFVTGRSSSVHWIPDSNNFVIGWRSGPTSGQLAVYDTATQLASTVTNDSGVKTDPWGWFAPEFGNELLMLAVIDDKAIGIYRDLGGPYRQRIATLTIPPGSSCSTIGSPEPFVANGRSYISLTIKDPPPPGQSFAPGEIWVFGIDDGPATRFVRRCDDGAAGVARFDPEVFVGSTQAFVYYNRTTTGDLIEMWGCPTGVWVGPIGDCDHSGDVDLTDFVRLGDCAAAPDATAAGPCACFDSDGDGDVDLVDITPFQSAFVGGA